MTREIEAKDAVTGVVNTTKQRVCVFGMAAAFCFAVPVAMADDPLHAKEKTLPYIRWSELRIEPARLDRFAALVNDNIQQTRSTEPEVTAFYSAADKEHPDRVRVLEIYADAKAYQTHLQTAHFQQFRSDTSHIVLDHQLFEAVPLMLGAKPGLPPAGAQMRLAEMVIDPASSTPTKRR